MNKNHKFFCNGKSLQYARSKTLTTSTCCSHLQWICPRKSWALALQFNTEFQFNAKEKKNQAKADLFSFSVWVENKFLKFLIRLPRVSDIFGRQFSPVCVFFAFAYFIATNISYRINHFSSALKTFCNPFAFPITRSSLVPTEIRQMIKYQSLSVCVSWWRYILTCTGFTRLAGIGALLIHVNFVG